jgi:hypothetical protein
MPKLDKLFHGRACFNGFPQLIFFDCVLLKVEKFELTRIDSHSPPQQQPMGPEQYMLELLFLLMLVVRVCRNNKKAFTKWKRHQKWRCYQSVPTNDSKWKRPC